MTFNPGQKVSASGLFREGEVISAANSRGEYQVRIGAVTLWVAADRLKSFDPPKKKSGKSKISKMSSGTAETGASAVKIDLHGKTVREAEQILESALDSALMNGSTLIDVIHGIGSGKIKSLVHDFARRSSQIAELREDMSNPGRCLLYL